MTREEAELQYYREKQLKTYYGGCGMFRFMIGLLLVGGSVGRHDFYDECLAAADCVAGDPPSFLITALIAVCGLALMGWGVKALNNNECWK